MARRKFWADPYSIVVNPTTGSGIPSATVTLWTLRTGGVQITDLFLMDDAGAATTAITQLTCDSNGYLPSFLGPPDGTQQMWADAGVAGGRKMLTADLEAAAGTGTNLMLDDGNTTPLNTLAGTTHNHVLADMPAGSVFYRRYAGSWPVRGSTRSDIQCRWIKNAVADPDPAIDSTYAKDGVDVLERRV